MSNQEGAPAPPLNLICNRSTLIYTSASKIILYDTATHTFQETEMEGWIRAAAVNSDGTRIAVAHSKYISILDSSNLNTIVATESEKRAIAMVFTSEGDLLLANKIGRVQQWTSKQQELSVNPEDNTRIKPKTILGHCSVLTDIVYAPTGKVLTADKNWKIRVSTYPEAANIEAFCLGHTEFVSRVLLVGAPEESTCVSGGGDGTLRLWDYSTGSPKACVELALDPVDENEKPESLPLGVASDNTIVVARGRNLFTYKSQNNTLELVSTVLSDNRILNGTLLSENLVIVGLTEAPYFKAYSIEQGVLGEATSFPTLAADLTSHLLTVDEQLKAEILLEVVGQLLARRTANLKDRVSKRNKF